MTLIEEQGQTLNELFPGATLANTGDGSYVITVPNVSLPDGWNAKTTTVRFIAPVGFPASRPDCFWTDASLRLSSGQIPANTGQTPLPTIGTPLLWFSWHVQRWSPNFDSLLTYMRVIQKRFSEIR